MPWHYSMFGQVLWVKSATSRNQDIKPPCEGIAIGDVNAPAVDLKDGAHSKVLSSIDQLPSATQQKLQGITARLRLQVASIHGWKSMATDQLT